MINTYVSAVNKYNIIVILLAVVKTRTTFSYASISSANAK